LFCSGVGGLRLPAKPVAPFRSGAVLLGSASRPGASGACRDSRLHHRRNDLLSCGWLPGRSAQTGGPNMTGRLAAVWMVVCAFAALHYLCSPVRGSTFSGPGAGTAALLPRQVGDYRMRDTWLTKASGAMYEVGGLYSPWNAPKNEVELFVLL